MKTWDAYKDHVKKVDPDAKRDIEEMENIADLVGDLSAVFNKRPAVEDCTTMPEHRERKKYEYGQSL